MPYYRHNTEKILYSLPDNPVVTRKTYKGKFAGWTISGTMEITYADNPIKPETGDLAYPTTKAAVGHYEAKDSRDEALRDYFFRWVPDTTEIKEGEYRRIRQEYLQA